MKWLKQEVYDLFVAKSSAWDSVVENILRDNPEMKAEDITSKLIISALDGAGGDNDLESKLKNALGEVKSKDAEIVTLTSEVAALKGTPQPKATVLGNDGDEAQEDILDIVAKESGDTAAVLVAIEKNGFFKQ